MFPQSIICLTEESVETLYLLGKQNLISGISAYVERPIQAKKSHPVVSVFTHSNIKKIVEINPDLILGFSDIQKDPAAELIGHGLNVFIANHRSINEIINYVGLLSRVVDAQKQGDALIQRFKDIIERFKELSSKLKKRPKVYFEEWDSPMISAIQWVAEAIEISGGDYIFAEKSQRSLAKDRFVDSSQIIEKNPDIVFLCWCGKKADIPSFCSRKGYENICAVKNKNVFELGPEIFLQPGPAIILDGLEIFYQYFKEWNDRN